MEDKIETMNIQINIKKLDEDLKAENTNVESLAPYTKTHF